ncbi:MAG TPA: Mor transcription activator family protein [Rhodanobacteraceae bacterium]|nr:Mor transcription activator family protein [Rhodanobacteraceae bacterium]
MNSIANTMAMRRHELLAEVEQTVMATALDIGADKHLAEHLGAAVADMLAESWAGQQITFPLNGHYGLSPRELEIATQNAAGKPVWKLAREHRMTERGVRKLLSRVAARLTSTDPQLDLFDPEDGA